jgi:hypothetical protein
MVTKTKHTPAGNEEDELIITFQGSEKSEFATLLHAIVTKGKLASRILAALDDPFTDETYPCPSHSETHTETPPPHSSQ